MATVQTCSVEIMSRNRTLSKIVRARVEWGPNGRRLCRWCRIEVKPPRLTFCSDSCVHEWKLRSDPRYLRWCVWKRDKGVCQKCWYTSKNWYADHHRPVVLGGGECGLSNIRTLCYNCHAIATAWLRSVLVIIKRTRKCLASIDARM